MTIAPKVEATSAGRTMFSLPRSRFWDVTQEHCVTSKKPLRGRLCNVFFCHLCQFVVVYTFPLHYSRGITYGTPKFGISNVIIQMLF